MQVSIEQRSDNILTGQRPWIRLLPEDGWLTLLLLVVVVFTTVASIQSVTPPWAPGLGILSLTTGMGLLLGYIAVQQGRVPGSVVHGIALILGIVFAFQQTADATTDGNRGALLQHTRIWFEQSILKHESSSDNTVFLLFLAILTFLLAYISIWLVLHSRRPWLAALANGVVLLINLNWATQDKAVFFIILFLLSTLLLLVRFTLAENIRVWRARGLRFSPDLGWDFMQAGAIFAVVVLTLANILPAGAANTNILSAWNSPNNPWQGVQTTFQTLFGGVQGGRGATAGGGFNFFGSNLTLGGNPHLPNVPILSYTPVSSSNDPEQYLITQTLDQYREDGLWSSSAVSEVTQAANTALPSGLNASNFKINAYHVTVDQPLAGNPLFAPGSVAASFSLASQTTETAALSTPSRWNSVSDQAPGSKYQAEAYVSTATQNKLQQEKSPAQLLADDPALLAQQYPSAILNEYLYSTPKGSLPNILDQDAHKWTLGTTNMYDAMTNLQDVFWAKFHYSLTVSPPNGADPLVWFLNNKVGFCTYFATAMALMARDLGMPSRIAMGFASGQYNSKSNDYVILGTQAHAWPQIYFGQYGWINFEPTSSFPLFQRGTSGNGASTGSPVPVPVNPNPRGHPDPTKGHPLGGGASGSKASAQSNPLLVGAGVSATLLLVFALLAAILLSMWWRLLYRGLSPVLAAFARTTQLGGWAGVVPKLSETPTEYMEQLSQLVPGQRPALERLSDLYARERWGGGLSPEALGEVSHLYSAVRASLLQRIWERVQRAPIGVAARVRRLLRGGGETGAGE